jgi:hypothetical protein
LSKFSQNVIAPRTAKSHAWEAAVSPARCWCASAVGKGNR